MTDIDDSENTENEKGNQTQSQSKTHNFPCETFIQLKIHDVFHEDVNEQLITSSRHVLLNFRHIESNRIDTC